MPMEAPLFSLIPSTLSWKKNDTFKSVVCASLSAPTTIALQPLAAGGGRAGERSIGSESAKVSGRALKCVKCLRGRQSTSHAVRLICCRWISKGPCAAELLRNSWGGIITDCECFSVFPKMTRALSLLQSGRGRGKGDSTCCHLHLSDFKSASQMYG